MSITLEQLDTLLGGFAVGGPSIKERLTQLINKLEDNETFAEENRDSLTDVWDKLSSHESLICNLEKELAAVHETKKLNTAIELLSLKTKVDALELAVETLRNDLNVIQENTKAMIELGSTLRRLFCVNPSPAEKFEFEDVRRSDDF